jgi:hypothetical protein
MIRHLTAAAALALAVSTTLAQEQAELPVTGVTLYTSGVGFFEHGGTVAGGDTRATLRFEAKQIDDLLKSLVLQDLDGGTVRAVTYAADGPLDRQLDAFQIDLGGDASLANLLKQLKGAELELITGEPEPVTGTVVSIDRRMVGEDLQADFVTLFTGTGLVSLAIDDVRTFEILDAKLQEEFAAALAAVASSRDKDKRPVAINFTGEGERRVRLGYVVEAPVWKTSYRLLLDGQTDEASMQGWAIVENQTDFDWDDVELGLVSGQPSSFTMPLSTPLFASRPEVAVPVAENITPRVYDGGVPATAAAPQQAMRRRGGNFQERDAMLLDTANAPEDRELFSGGGLVANNVGGIRRQALFEYEVGSVSIERQTSAMIPVIGIPVQAEQVALFDTSLNLDHAMTAVLLENTTEQLLPAGPVAVYDLDGFAGDARISDLPAGDDRLLSYGVDLDVTVTSDSGQGGRTVTSGTLSGGVLTLQIRNVYETTYTISNEGDDAKTVILQKQVVPGVTFLGDVTPFETTPANEARFRTVVEPGQTELAVRYERTIAQRIQLLDDRVDSDQLLALSKGGAISDDLREALKKGAELLREISRTQEQVENLEAQLRSITQEQQRLRQNMQAVDRNSDYYKRLLGKLDEQETQIEQLRESLAALEEDRSQKYQGYRDFLSDLQLQ